MTGGCGVLDVIGIVPDKAASETRAWTLLAFYNADKIFPYIYIYIYTIGSRGGLSHQVRIGREVVVFFFFFIFLSLRVMRYVNSIRMTRKKVRTIGLPLAELLQPKKETERQTLNFCLSPVSPRGGIPSPFLFTSF